MIGGKGGGPRAESHKIEVGAGDRIRTGDINLGKVALYQLSYSRVVDLSILASVSLRLSISSNRHA